MDKWNTQKPVTTVNKRFPNTTSSMFTKEINLIHFLRFLKAEDKSILWIIFYLPISINKVGRVVSNSAEG